MTSVHRSGLYLRAETRKPSKSQYLKLKSRSINRNLVNYLAYFARNSAAYENHYGPIKLPHWQF